MGNPCLDCGEPFEVSARELDRMRRRVTAGGLVFQHPKRCRACRARDRRVVADGADQELTCIECRLPFTFTATSKQHYARMNYPRPIKCRTCREKLKTATLLGRS